MVVCYSSDLVEWLNGIVCYSSDLVEWLNGTVCYSFYSVLLLMFIKILRYFYVDD